MIAVRHLELAEGLFDLEPAASYPNRAATIVARLAGASGHKFVLGGDVVSRGGTPGAGDGMVIPVRDGEREVGSLHLWAPEGGGRFGEEAAVLARWSSRVLSRGLANVRKLERSGKEGVDVQAMLANTPLTPRERDVVGRLVSGHSTRDIASATGLTVATVNTYLKRIFAKLGVHSRVELLARVTGTHNAVS